MRQRLAALLLEFGEQAGQGPFPLPVTHQELASRLARQIGVPDYAVLFSVKEFKKVRLRYFLPELDRWWAERSGR